MPVLHLALKLSLFSLMNYTELISKEKLVFYSVSHPVCGGIDKTVKKSDGYRQLTTDVLQIRLFV